MSQSRGSGSQQQGGGDNSLSVLWGVVGIFIAAAVVWYMWQAQIVHAIFLIKLFEINLLGLFTGVLASTADAIRNIPANQYGSVPPSAVIDLSVKVGNVLRIPVAVILGTLAAVIYVSHAVLHYRKIYTMSEFLSEETINW